MISEWFWGVSTWMIHDDSGTILPRPLVCIQWDLSFHPVPWIQRSSRGCLVGPILSWETTRFREIWRTPRYFRPNRVEQFTEISWFSSLAAKFSRRSPTGSNHLWNLALIWCSTVDDDDVDGQNPTADNSILHEKSGWILNVVAGKPPQVSVVAQQSPQK